MVRVVAGELLGASCIEEVLVVTGHDAPAVEGALDGLNVRFVFNADNPAFFLICHVGLCLPCTSDLQVSGYDGR